MEIDVLCIGHAAYDLSVFLSEYPKENCKYETRALQESGGGPAANAAFLLAKWGVRCAFAGLVGMDESGAHVREELAAAGVEVSLLERRPGHLTPFSVILVNRLNASRTIMNRKAPTASLRLESATLAGWEPKVLLFDGHELEASLAAIEAFPKAIRILDAGTRRSGTAKLAGQVHYLAASERFALQTSGLPDLKSAAARKVCVQDLRTNYRNKVVVTLGEKGLLADDGEGFRHLPAFPARAVDTTAAGDIFHGALAYAVLREMPFNEMLRFSSMAAALSVETHGGRTSMPSLAAVEEALVSRKGPY